MTLPTLSKTWQMNVNQTVTAQGSGNATAARIMRTLKNLLKGFALNPWTCSGSSNAGGSLAVPTGAAALDGVDRWTTDADIAITSTSARHSWIVLRQDGIASHYELCLDLLNAGNAVTIAIVISPGATFTGGSATARPTATDELVLFGNTIWLDGQNTQHQINVWQSTDGQCTRVIIYDAASTVCTFWLFDKPQNPVSGWNKPSVSIAFGNNLSSAISYSSLATNIANMQGFGTTPLRVQLTGEGSDTNFLANTTSIGTIINDFDSNWSIFPIGFISSTIANRGRLGNLFDLWWKPSGVADGDTFPNDSANRQFVAFACLLFPWTGDSTTASLA